MENPFSEDYSAMNNLAIQEQKGEIEITKDILEKIENDYPLDKPRRITIRAKVLSHEND